MLNIQEKGKKISILAISDTHSRFQILDQLADKRVKPDIFIFAGDFTRYGREEHFFAFFRFLDRMEAKHKIVIAGNHEISLDPNMPIAHKSQLLNKYPCKLTREQILTQLKKRCIYLQHEPVEIEGLTIFGSPFTPKYSRSSFNYPKKDDETVWNTLPVGIDILVTHCPPFGILDKTSSDQLAGSPALKKWVLKNKPKLHIFGHIHQSRGKMVMEGITFLNVAKEAHFYNWIVFSMIDHSKDGKELTFLYDWMRIARKPNQTLRQDIKMLFELISIPVSESELDIIQKAINPTGNKTQLKKEDLLACFVVQEECRKPKEKQLLKAFRYVSNEEDDISFSNLQDYFREEGIDSSTSEMILKQLAEYQNEQGKFDYKAFTANLY